MDDECPVCLCEIPLARLWACSTRHGHISGCAHAICMQCAMRIANTNPICPLCRASFTTIIQNLNCNRRLCRIEYHVESNSLLPGLMNNSAFAMGIANNLIFEHDGEGGYEVLLPEYLRNVPGCQPILRLVPYYNIEDEDLRHLQLLDEMDRAVAEVENLPMIFSRVVIGRYIDIFVQEGFFTLDVVEPDDIDEDEREYKWWIMSREVTPFGHWQSRDFSETE
jgi:hypothetical protein